MMGNWSKNIKQALPLAEGCLSKSCPPSFSTKQMLWSLKSTFEILKLLGEEKSLQKKFGGICSFPGLSDLL